MLADLRYAFRSLIRAPLFTAGVVLTLALGIGVNATMFGVVDILFLRAPEGVRDAGALRRIYFERNAGAMGTFTGPTTSYPTFKDLRDGVPSFTTVTALTSPRAISLGRGAAARAVQASLVSHSYFGLLGVRAFEGRLFDENDDKPGAPGVAVLSHAFWRRHFGADHSVLGRSLNIGRANYVVVGIGAEGFSGIDLGPVDIWLPIEAAAAAVVGDAEAVTSRGWMWLQTLGRLRPGTTDEQAVGQATPAFRAGMSQQARVDSTARVLLAPIQKARAPNAGNDARVSAWIGAVALAVLLIACANVANLLLARGVARRRELAVRAGLGAGRGGLMRLLLAESMVLAGLGGISALAVAVWSGQVLRSLLLPDLPADVPVIDVRVLAFTVAAIVATALLAGLVPAFQSSRTDVAGALKSGGSHGATRTGGRTRSVLLAAQVALTLVLLAGAGLFVRSLRNVQAIRLGFDTGRTLAASLDLASLELSPEASNALYLRLVDRVSRLPGVEAAAATMGSPFGYSHARNLRVSGLDSMPELPSGGPYFQLVTTNYNATMGAAILRGRDLGAGDGAGTEKVAVVNEYMARVLWPGAEALDQCLFVGEDNLCRRVVGVVENAQRWGVVEEPSALYYVPMTQYPGTINALMIRSRTRGSDVTAAVRQAIEAEGNLPFASVEPLVDLVAPHLRSWRLGAGAFSAFGLLALVIAATGIFAVISYGVTQRTREIGVRIALGATARQVIGSVLGTGMRATLAGLAAGAIGAWLLGRSISGLLYGVGPADPVVFGGVVLVLLTAAAIAALMPARRAARVDPMIALRAE